MATLNLSSLTKYTDQLASGLIADAVTKARTFDYISIQKGVKYASALNVMNSSLTVQAGHCATVNPSGGPVLSQRSIAVCDLKVEESICLNDLEDYFIGKMAKQGSYNETAPDEFNTVYVADKVAKLQNVIETIFWQGDTTGSGNIAQCDGMIKLLNAASGVTKVGAGSGTKVAMTSANALITVRAMIAALPEAILEREDLVMFVSNANFNTIMNALIAENNYHYTALDAAKTREFVFPGSNVKIVGVGGLSGSFQAVLTYAENLFLGTDLMSDAEAFQMWYEMKDDLVYFRAKWKQGVQVAFPQYVVLYTGVPA